MTELDLKYQDLKKKYEELQEENERIRFSNSLLEKELKEYKELDEKGLLLRLPCKVGDKAYHVIKDDIAVPSIYISEHEIQDVSAKAVYFADDWWTFEEMKECNAFLNREEAELALIKNSDKCVSSIEELYLGYLKFPVAAVHVNPLDYPGKAIARIFDTDKPTNTVIIKDTLEEIMEDIRKNTTMVFVPRGAEDAESLVGVWV